MNKPLFPKRIFRASEAKPRGLLKHQGKAGGDSGKFAEKGRNRGNPPFDFGRKTAAFSGVCSN
jgi:hypothetical protein